MLSCSFCQGAGVIYPRGTIRRTKETTYDISIPPKSWPGRIVEVSGKKFVLIPTTSETLLNSGLDLIYINKIDIFKALLGVPEKLDILRETYDITHTGPVQPKHKILFEGRGLYGPQGNRGNLIFAYDIVFPESLTPLQRNHLTQIVNN